MKLHTILNSASKYAQHPELLQLRSKGVTASQYLRYAPEWIRTLKPRTIFDIGANIGQSAVALNVLYPDARVYSFEPIPTCFNILEEKTRDIPNIQCFNVGLGDSTEETKFELNEFPASSSFLPLSDIHKEAFSYASKTETIDVKIEKLDDIMQDFDLQPPIVFKIDVQGLEDKVLLGGESIVKKSAVLIIETSFEPLYINQPLFDDVYQLMRSWGFSYKGSLENTIDPRTGKIIQSDSVFVSNAV